MLLILLESSTLIFSEEFGGTIFFVKVILGDEMCFVD
jgi:hypothetical protein